MIPNVYMNWCHRRAKCAYCPEYIEAGEPMVNVFYWNRGNEEKRGINAKFYYHPQCWIDNGLDYLKMNPYIPYIRHKKSELGKEQKEQRYLILRRKAKADQRKRELSPNRPDYALVMAGLDRQIAELMVKIAQVGGIPKKWLE